MSMSQLKALDDWAGPSRPATVADVMRPSATTVEDTDHVAAAAYLMKHAHTAALMVLDAQHTARPVGIITEADIAQAVADGKDVNEARVHEVMTVHAAAIPAAASIRDATRIMLAGGQHQLPVAGGDQAGGAGLVGIVDIADLCAVLLDEQEPRSSR